jgi:hypothetical protein
MTNRILELKEKVFDYIDKNGPLLPYIVAKEFRVTNIFVSALMSELVSNKRIKISKAKIGGSPLYYIKHQEAKLVDMLRNHIGQKPKEALDLLREKRVLRDRDCLPYERVALRDLEDFAIPVKLVINDIEEVFWKWYLLPDEDAKDLIGKILEQLYSPPKKEEKKAEVKEHKEPKKKKKFLQDVLVEKKPKMDSDFEKLVSDYFKKKEIKILEKISINKKKEFNLIVQVPTSVGELSYFVKARSKKSLSEGDLLLAFTEGQNMKLPTLFISNGDVTKKANEYMGKNLKGMSFIKLR